MAIYSRYKAEFGKEVEALPVPIQNTDNPYLTEAAMHADQANQLEGYGYLVTDVGAFTYLGTLAGTAEDYEPFGGGLDLRASNLAGDLSVSEQDDFKEKIAIEIDSNFRPFITKWNITTGDVIELPTETTDYSNYFRIEWGDGTIENYTGATPCTHTYNTTGEFIVKIYGRLESWAGGSFDNDDTKLTEISQWGDTEWKLLQFTKYHNLATLPVSDSPNLLKCITIPFFKYCALTSIPANIFETGRFITHFNGAFLGNDITAIPSGLFDKCFNALDFTGVFWMNKITAVPADLFKYNVNAKIFGYAFRENLITTVDPSIFDYAVLAEDFQATFYDNDIAQFPTGIHKNNYRLKDISQEFRYNYSMQGIADPLWNRVPAIDGETFINGEQLTNYADIPTFWGGTSALTYGQRISKHIWTGSQAEYDRMPQVWKDDATFTKVIGDGNVYTGPHGGAQTLTGTALDLSNVVGNNYNYAAFSSATTYTTTTPVINGFARCFINAASEPTVTDATKVGLMSFEPNVNMEMVVNSPNGVAVEFEFITR